MPERVRITEVALRDGLQNEPGIVETADKARLARALFDISANEIELTSFVRPDRIPQLADAAELCAELLTELESWQEKHDGIVSALVPNAKGMERVLELNERLGHKVISKVGVFTAASETFSLRNTGVTIEEGLRRFEPVVEMADAHAITVRGYISTAIACPFEGKIDPHRAVAVAEMLWHLGIAELDFADTIGYGDAANIAELLEIAFSRIGAPGHAENPHITLHLHDTRGRAAECIREALDMGVRSFDSAALGIGGCPYAVGDDGKAAPGNIDTRSLCDAIEDAGFQHDLSIEQLTNAENIARDILATAREQENQRG